MHSPIVEVRKNPKSTTWYNAVMVDMSEGNIRVRFEDEVWLSREVPAHSVRFCPDPDDDGFNPVTDDMVEVKTDATKSQPSAWSLGRVKNVKNLFYFIAFVGAQKDMQDPIVERGAIRRVSNQQSIDPSKYVRRLVLVPQELHRWICTQDSQGCLSHMQAKARLLIASTLDTEPDGKCQPKVLLIGDECAINLSEKLLELVHFKNQANMQRYHDLREGFMERLAQKKQHHQTQHKEVFVVAQHIVGRIIGKKGENINLVRKQHRVEIEVLDDDGTRGYCTVTVTGPTAEAVRGARGELEFITEFIPLEREEVGWVLGKGLQNITEIAKKTDLHYARYNDDTGCIELCGLKHQVEAAAMLINVHCDYLHVYQDMDDETNNIQQCFDELENNAGYRSSWKGANGNASRSGADTSGKSSWWSREEGYRDEASEETHSFSHGEGRGKGRRRGDRGRKKVWK